MQGSGESTSTSEANKPEADPLQQGLNLDRYNELMEQAKERYGQTLDDPASLTLGVKEGYDEAKTKALNYLEARAMKEAQAQGKFVFKTSTPVDLGLNSKFTPPKTGKSTMGKKSGKSSASKSAEKPHVGTKSTPTQPGSAFQFSADTATVFQFDVNIKADEGSANDDGPGNGSEKDRKEDSQKDDDTSKPTFKFGNNSKATFQFGSPTS